MNIIPTHTPACQPSLTRQNFIACRGGHIPFSRARAITYDYPHTQEEVEITSNQSLRYEMPVCPIEELFLHMIVQAGMRWMWRVLIVEDELGRFVLSRL
jgi:hypothetical protein